MCTAKSGEPWSRVGPSLQSLIKPICCWEQRRKKCCRILRSGCPGNLRVIACACRKPKRWKVVVYTSVELFAQVCLMLTPLLLACHLAALFKR